MQNRRLVLKTAIVFPVLWPSGLSASESARLEIASDGDDLVFKPVSLSCVTGIPVTLVLSHTGKIIHDVHNWVLLKPGTLQAFLTLAIALEDPSIAIPPGAEGMVLAASPFCALGQTVEVAFLAPPPGDYPFVCSVPGHGETMNGVLHVTAWM